MVGRLSPWVLVFVVFLGLTGCGGSSGSASTSNTSGIADDSRSTETFLVSTQVGTGGMLSPASITVSASDSAIFTVAAHANYVVDTVSGCGGSLAGNLYTTGPVTANCTVTATFTFQPPTAQLSGRLFASAGLEVDADTNDVLAGNGDNSTPSLAQSLNHLARVQGFASAIATGGSSATERFASTADPNDFYRAVLEAGQVIQLQVVDFIGHTNGGRFEGELDLLLFDLDYNLVGVADNAGEFKEIVVGEAGEYFINIHAHTGIAKYVLQLLPVSSAALETTASLTRLPEFVPNEMLVKYTEESLTTVTAKATPPNRPSWAGRLAKRLGIDAVKMAPGKAMQELKSRNPATYDKVMTLRSIKTMNQRADVEYAEPNYIRRGLAATNDPHYALQWHYQTINLPDAWAISTGTENDVIVAVVDTGVLLAHPDLTGQLLAGYDFISDAERARDGDGIDSNPNDPGDSDIKGESSWHGTHVAGTVAAASNNDTGVAGISWGAKIMPLRVLGKGGGTSYDVLQAVRYAAGFQNDSNTLPARRADIINLSLGGYTSSRAENDLYQAVRDAGVMLVAAAGNDASSEPLYPASYSSVISVSATDYADKRAYYSNFGAGISLAAPGGDMTANLNGDRNWDGVLSTSASESDKGALQYNYRFSAGTSMAAPHVAGVLALMKSVYPALSPAMVGLLLQDGKLTDDLGPTGWDSVFGHGRLNALSAVQAAVELASGRELSESPAHIVADPDQLDLGFQSTNSLTLTNQGGGDPLIAGVTASLAGITVTPDAIDASGIGSYQVLLDRTGLEGGTYTGEITFTLEDASSITIPLTFQVELATSAGRLPRTYALLLDAETHEVISRTAVEGGSEYADFRFDQVTPGAYFIVSGSDIDADQKICTVGETCGGYPRLDKLGVVNVDGSDVSGLNFTNESTENIDNLPTEIIGTNR